MKLSPYQFYEVGFRPLNGPDAIHVSAVISSTVHYCILDIVRFLPSPLLMDRLGASSGGEPVIYMI